MIDNWLEDLRLGVRQLVRRSLVLVAYGGACGLALYLALASLLQRDLHTVSACDPATTAAVVAILVLVAALATLAPARAALRVPVSEALRSE